MALNPLTIQDLKFLEGKQPGIVVYYWGSRAVSCAIEVLTREGLERYKFTSTSDRGMGSFEFRLTNLPMMVTCGVREANVRRGEVYALARLRAAGLALGTLFSGYIHHERDLFWPPGQSEGMVEGPGQLRSITGTDPAAGAEISETVPTNARWRLASVRWTFVTDATVATRGCCITVDDGTTVLMFFPPGQTQAASLTRRYTATHIGMKEETGYVDGIVVPLPPNLTLFQGWRIRTSTVNLQAADNYGAPQLLVEEWLEE